MDTSRRSIELSYRAFAAFAPAVPHETLNQRQAAVLDPCGSPPQPGAAIVTQQAIHLRKRRTVAFPGGAVVPKHRCFAYRRSASRHLGRKSRHPAISRGSDWRFTAGEQRDRFQVTPVDRHYSRQISWRASEEDEVSAVF